MALAFTASARGLGIWSAAGTVFLGVVYPVTLVAGLLSPQQPIGDPLFSILEIIGYAGVFPIAVLLLTILFYRAKPRET